MTKTDQLRDAQYRFRLAREAHALASERGRDTRRTLAALNAAEAALDAAEDALAALTPTTWKGVSYWPAFEAARAHAEAHGLPTDRIIKYGRGWAIQLAVSGPYG